MRRRGVVLISVLAALGGLGNEQCQKPQEIPPGDPLAGDPIDPETGEAAYIVPGAPWLRVAEEHERDAATASVVAPGVVGDVDLVIRSGRRRLDRHVPPPSAAGSPPSVTAAPFGAGIPVPFSVAATSGGADVGHAVAPDYVAGLPMLVMAFADLDADGLIGVTHLDGDPTDALLEEQELRPIGRRYAIARKKSATGELSLEVGGPAGLDVALTAAAIAGPFENPNVPCAGCHWWPDSDAAVAVLMPLVQDADVEPEGPVITTRIPFLPDPEIDFLSGPRGLVPAHPDARVALQVEIAMVPDPADPRIGEAFTLRLDGSQPSIDAVRSFSGPPIRLALTQPVVPSTWRPRLGRELRPGLAASGAPAPVEVVQQTELDAPADFRVTAIDALGNVAMPIAPAAVIVRTHGDILIEAPDADGDPYREVMTVSDAVGTSLRLAPSGGTEARGAVWLEGIQGISRVAIGEPAEPAGDPPDGVVLPPDTHEDHY